MKNITGFLYEHMESVYEGEESVKDEKSFREWAEAKFEAVFGDDLDKDQMKETIDGFLKENAKLVKDGEWGELVGMMNQSFADK